MLIEAKVGGKNSVYESKKETNEIFFFSLQTYTKNFVIAFGVDLKLGKSLREIM